MKTMKTTWTSFGTLMLALSFVVGSIAAPVQAEVRLPEIFGDHMVLQRDIDLPVWGWAAPGEKITVTFGDQSVSTTADANGLWKLKLKPMKANTNAQEFVITSSPINHEPSTIILKDVLVGDVWLCSGQSNMEWELNGCNRPEDIRQADLPCIRMNKVRNETSQEPRDDMDGSWTVCTPQTAGGFIAVGFYFARELYQETGVPMGIIAAEWGGSPIEPWIPLESLRTCPEMKEFRDQYVNSMKNYRLQVSNNAKRIIAEIKTIITTNAFVLPPPPRFPDYPRGWSEMYNGMIHPLAPYGIKGALWYQGESNGGEGDSYYQKKVALITGWRARWNQGDFPFYFVQLANFQSPNPNPEGGDGWARVREAQSKSLTIPKTGLAVAIDLADPGNPGDIHPKNKLDVGRRLALWALAKDYGKKVVYSGPLYADKRIEDGKIRLAFRSTGGGLIVGRKDGYEPTEEIKNGTLKGFAIAGEDKKWYWADAVIEGKTVVVSSPDVANPVAVRYAFSMNPADANLYNKEGLPASPFRTDDW